MIGRLLRRGGERRRTVETLHGRINDASRRPALYEGLGVPDTVEGRFECLCLHVILALRRLNRLPEPGPDIAQDLVNSVFLQLDASLRELGVGDMGVPKRMKKLGAAFYGRAAGYDAALDAGDRDALAAALARNVIGREEADAGPLADYVRASADVLGAADLAVFLGAGPLFPDPSPYGSHR